MYDFMTDCKYKLIIFNYNDRPPCIIFADKDNNFPCLNLADVYKGIKGQIQKHWQNSTWWFKEKEYGLHAFELDDWSKFYEELKNYE